MTRGEAINWIINLTADIGKMEHQDLWHYEQALEEIRGMIEALPSVQSEPSKTFHVIDTHTGEEADPYEIALNEDWAKHLMYCDMEGFAIEEDGTLLLLDECGQHEYCPSERFEVTWDYE